MMGVLTLHLSLPGCRSLKEKRGRLQPLLHRLRREFNLSTAEMDLQDLWDEAVVACGMVGNEGTALRRALQKVQKWVEGHWSEGEVLDDHIEII